MLFDWMSDPTAWLGLATLIVLEIVLGIDNLVFIAILAEKLPEHQRDRARLIGLSLALLMRLGLLASIAWIVTLTAPLFSVFGHSFSGRDLILFFGGAFLLYKATTELHERVEGATHGKSGSAQYASFFQVIAQIVVLDAVFSLDSVITAVGMVDELSIMMTAVIVAMIVMVAASKPLVRFVGRHPTVIVLCLGLLLMIGFSLVAEGLGFHVPKGYLYAAIGFAILIECFNQLAQRNRLRRVSAMGRRERTAHAVLALLGGRRSRRAKQDELDDSVVALPEDDLPVFAPEESTMVERVLEMGARSVDAIMVPRRDMVWLGVRDTSEDVLRKFASGHSRLPLCDGDASNVIGVLHFKDAMQAITQPGALDLVALARPPRFVTDAMPVIRLVEEVRQSREHMLIVVDEHGGCAGLVTPMDILEAVAGDLPEHDADGADSTAQPDGSWLLSGRLSVDEAARLLDAPELRDDFPDDTTLAGCLLRLGGRIPEEGEVLAWREWEFQVSRRSHLRIEQVTARQAARPRH
ncbi:Magnesium and cobalt efflux protein CorC [plant metagenome]|uniref:Magnesium and cobalt efflux protein CorC n=1 Tax=plant metagenome TaxID=1297885 RepID=A0A484TZB4_9ZZZZ